ncbi:MAG: PHP domain-containing protein [Clostridia bacterium]|nr:PHP domain-containing protein [Clostridia bacterium]
MFLTSDYHTHTVFSHGKGTILDNAKRAKDLGLKEIAISDHGFSHPAFGLTKRKLPKMRLECDNASKETGVNVLLGIESNVIGTDGTVDLKPKLYDKFDVFLAGIHKLVLFKFKTWFSLGIPDLFCSTLKMDKVSKSLVKSNTKAIVNAIKKNPIDVITHLNFCSYTEVNEVAKAAADYGTYIELNAKKVHLTDEELYKILKTDAKFVISSDAHTPNRVGEISLVESMLSRVSVPRERIMNIDGKVPNFRFKAFKERG